MPQAIASSNLNGLRLQRRTGVQSRLVEGEMIVLDREHDLIHQFNKTATFIWEHCDGQQSAAEIANALCENFEVDEATALKEVIETLERLQNLRLIGDDQTDLKPERRTNYVRG
jgi:Coenzyme PQQ synthesis protein D (PqqD)